MVRWDSEDNFRRIDKYRKLWSSGCRCQAKHCRPGSACGCRRSDKPCGPSCLFCCEACQNQPENPSITSLLQCRYPGEDDDTITIDASNMSEFIIEEICSDYEDSNASDISDLESDDQDNIGLVEVNFEGEQ